MDETPKAQPIKPVAKRFFDSLMLDQPVSLAILTDFGLDRNPDRNALYAAYQRAIRKGVVTLQELSDALGCGHALTELVRRVDATLSVRTIYDEIEEADAKLREVQGLH